MNGTSFTTSRKDEVPSCFGKDWDRNAAECAGGPESGYIHPKNGSHVRDQCNFFTSCGARTQAKNMSLIPTSSLLRPPGTPPVTPPIAPPQNFGDYLRQQRVDYVEQQRMAGMTAVRPATAPAVVPQQMPTTYQQAHLHYPATTYGLNYQMPSYLSVPEVRHPGESMWAVLWRVIFRSAGKAISHGISHFFDTTVLKDK